MLREFGEVQVRHKTNIMKKKFVLFPVLQVILLVILACGTSFPVKNNVKITSTLPLSSQTKAVHPNLSPTSVTTETSVPAQTVKTPTGEPLQIDRNELIASSDNYIGQYIVISGIVDDIKSSTEIQLFIGGEDNSPVYIISAEPNSAIYQDEDVVVYGIVGSIRCGTNTSGVEVCQPTVTDACIVHHVYVNGNVKKGGKGERPTPSYAKSPCV